MSNTPRPGRPRTRTPDGPAADIGAAIRQRREAAGLSQVALALACTLSVRTLHNYEGGLNVPPLDVAGRIAAALGCTVDDLL